MLTARPTVMVCTAEVGCGHTRAATAVALALREHRPRIDSGIIDALEFAPAWFTAPYRNGYVALTQTFPSVAGWLYDRTDSARPSRGGGAISAAIERGAVAKFVSSARVRAADVLVCTHFLCARVLAAAKARGQVEGRLVVVVTDQHPHAVWQTPGVDLYLVGTPAAAKTLIRRGVPGDNIEVTGIPIDARFERPSEKSHARERFDLDPEQPLALICGGGLGLGGLDRALDGLLHACQSSGAVVVCGHNAGLFRSLIAKMESHPARHRVRVIGVTSKMHELMAAADVLVGKPGGLTTAEAMASGLPMVLLRPIPGQEERNAAMLVAEGAAVLEPDPFTAGLKAAGLLKNQPTLNAMADAAARLGRGNSAALAAEAIMRLLQPQACASMELAAAR